MKVIEKHLSSALPYISLSSNGFRMAKKEDERKTFNLVYEESRYAEILDTQEDPDFKIRSHESANYFGVEVTTFYYSESNARLKNIPNYFEEIIEGDKFRHKDDVTVLAPDEGVIIAPDGTEKGKVRLLLRPQPTMQEYVGMLLKTIGSKEEKLANYDKTLLYVNLVILDSEARLFAVPKLDYFKELFTLELQERLYKTGFREIFLITSLEGRWVYVPLKMVLFISLWRVFPEILETYFPEKMEMSIDEFTIFFTQYMQVKQGNACYRMHKGYGIETIWNGTGVIWGEDQYHILHYQDDPVPDDTVQPSINGVEEFFRSEPFEKAFSEFLSNHTFTFGFVYDVKGNVDFFRGRMKEFIASEVLPESSVDSQ